MPISGKLVEKVPKCHPELPRGSLSGHANFGQAGDRKRQIRSCFCCQLRHDQFQKSFCFGRVAHLCMFLGLKSTLRFSRLHGSAMVARFFVSCACAAVPADAPPASSTPCAVRWRGRQKPLTRTRARGLWKKLRPVFRCRLPWPDFGAKIFWRQNVNLDLVNLSTLDENQLSKVNLPFGKG